MAVGLPCHCSCCAVVRSSLLNHPWLMFCRMSELRAVELLEDLCEDMDDYTLYTNTSDSAAEPEWVKFRGEGAVSERTWWVVATEDHQLEVPVLIAMPTSIRALQLELQRSLQQALNTCCRRH